MATVTEKLRFLLEADASGAVRGFGQAETGLTRLGKSASMSLTSMTKLAAGGAVVGGALLKAANQFKTLALESGKLADATGLSVVQASQWVEVLGDMSVESSTLESAIGRLNKTIGESPQKLDALGVAVVRSANGAVDVNETFLALVDRLNSIEDPAQRATVASQALGRGWQGLAEVIGSGSDSLRSALESVSDAKVFTDEEREDAEAYRESMDQLNDAMQDLAITLGQGVAPLLGEVASGIGETFEELEPLLKTIKDFRADVVESRSSDNWWERLAGAPFDSIIGNFKRVGNAWNDAFGDEPQDAAEDAADAVEGVGDALDEAGGAMDRFGPKADDAARNAAILAEDFAFAEWKADKLREAVDDLWDSLDTEIDAEEALLDLGEAFEAVADASVDQGESAKDAMVEQRRDILAAKRQVIDYGREILKLPPEALTDILAALDAGDVAEAERQLSYLTRMRTVKVGIVGIGEVFNDPSTPAGSTTDMRAVWLAAEDARKRNEAAANGDTLGFATGGVVPGPMGSPQLAVVHGGEEVLTPAQRNQRGGGATFNITVNAGLSSPRDTAKAIAELMTKYGYR